MRSRSSKKCSWVSAISRLSNDAKSLCSRGREAGAAAGVPGKAYRKGTCFRNVRREELIRQQSGVSLTAGLPSRIAHRAWRLISAVWPSADMALVSDASRVYIREQRPEHSDRTPSAKQGSRTAEERRPWAAAGGDGFTIPRGVFQFYEYAALREPRLEYSGIVGRPDPQDVRRPPGRSDRKSTRLNSSHS